MPFDGIGFSANEYSQKIDAVIDLLGNPERWGKGSFKTRDGRYCLRGALRTVDRNEVLGPTILAAIKEVTGKNYLSIERFNDSHRTEHAMVLTVLARARENVAAGRLVKSSTTAIRVSRPRRYWNRMTARFHLSI
ncbi:MAG TPA: hypothetical protein VFQ90_12595 [Stellaceae bacterium]|jgi:hypothetical protein|nr:hypothetical protein [Stellaceae bacterium]